MRNNDFMNKSADNYNDQYDPNSPYNRNTGYADNRMDQYPNSYVNGSSEANLINYSNDPGNNYSDNNIPGNLRSWTVNYSYRTITDRIFVLIFLVLLALIPFLKFCQIFLSFLSPVPLILGISAFIICFVYLIIREPLNRILKKLDKNTYFTRNVSLECRDGKVLLKFIDNDGFEKGYTYTRFIVDINYDYLIMQTSDKTVNYKFRTAEFHRGTCRIADLYNYLKNNNIEVSMPDSNNHR